MTNWPNQKKTFELDAGTKFALILTIILVILCIVFGILAWIKERKDSRRLTEQYWYSSAEEYDTYRLG